MIKVISVSILLIALVFISALSVNAQGKNRTQGISVHHFYMNSDEYGKYYSVEIFLDRPLTKAERKMVNNFFKTLPIDKGNCKKLCKPIGFGIDNEGVGYWISDSSKLDYPTVIQAFQKLGLISKKAKIKYYNYPGEC